jgi:Mg2+/Co2+ transporter CorB
MEIGILISFGAVLLLLCLSAFFSGSETALTAASTARMHALANGGNKKAKRVNCILEHKERMIGALLLGNNLVNILASSLATSLLIKIFGQAGVVYATLAMTMLVLIFSEVMPKTYALHHADSFAMKVAPLVQVLILIFSPVTQMVSNIVRLMLRILGADISVIAVGSNVEELRGVIEMHRGPEKEVNEQRAMLRSILELADVEVSEIMTHRRNVAMIDVDQSQEKQIGDMLNSPHTRLPLWKGDPDNIIGVVNVKTVLKELQIQNGKIGKINMADLASEPWFVPDSTALNEQLQAFRDRREHFAMVVDEYGSFMGVVTLEDILEEIVGEIEDETDEIVAGVRRQPNGTFLVEGTVTIRDLNREFEWRLPDENYSTIAGLVLHEAQIIPDAGQSFHFYGFRFDVVRRQRHQIKLLRVTPPKILSHEQ